MAEAQGAVERGPGLRLVKNMNYLPMTKNQGDLSFKHPGFHPLWKSGNTGPRSHLATI
jgi:hypothetical protein